MTARQPFEAFAIPDAPFGIEIRTDVTQEFDAAQRKELRELYRKDGLLLFRDQALTMDQQLDACSIFGPVLRDSIENYLVSNVEEDGLLGTRELLFHHDVPYVPAPYLGGSLHALEVAGDVPSTRFASGLRAWDEISEEMQRRIEPMKALHVRSRVFTRRTRLVDSQPGDNCAIHALVGRQAETGRRYIFADMDMTALVAGLSEPESDALLEELFAGLYAGDNVYEHRWAEGDFVVWDNLAIQHARGKIRGGRRTLQRVTIAEYGYWDQYPVDLPTFDELHEQATDNRND